MMDIDELIAAVASPPGPAARGIIRISGASVAAFLDDMLGGDAADGAFDPRVAARYPRIMRLDAVTRLPVAVQLWPTARSYTGQPMAELHMVGSPPLLEAVLEVLVVRGCRLARPGEFTLRSFLAGRIDLTQAEAVLGVIDAEDRSQLETALSQLAGGLSCRLGNLREQLLCDLADLEAGLDFADEDLEFVSRAAVGGRVESSIQDILSLEKTARRRHRESGRPQVVLAGLPNAGKSSLYNALLGNSAAIVSGVAGTTRDVLQARLDLAEVTVDLFDTAGWELAEDEVMGQAGIQRGVRLDTADVVIWCEAADATDSEIVLSRSTRWTLDREPDLFVRTKCDRVSGAVEDANSLQCSAQTGGGLSDLRQRIADVARGRHGRREEILPSTAVRCQADLAAALTALRGASEGIALGLGDEIVSMELRQALDHLGEITGAFTNEDMLDRLFSRFCIGK